LHIYGYSGGVFHPLYDLDKIETVSHKYNKYNEYYHIQKIIISNPKEKRENGEGSFGVY